MPGPEFERNAPPQAIVEGLEEHGYVIVHRLADPGTLARMNADFDPYLNAVQLGATDFAGHKTKRINHLIAKSEACQALAMNPTVMAPPNEVTVRFHNRSVGNPPLFEVFDVISQIKPTHG